MGAHLAKERLKSSDNLKNIPRVRESFRKRLTRSLSASLVHLTNNRDNHTSLFTAIAARDVEYAKLLLKSKAGHAKINEKNKDEQTALFIAVQNGSLKLIELLLKHGANPNLWCKVELEMEDVYKHPLAFNFLCGGNIMDDISSGSVFTYRTALIEATWLDSTEVLQKLLKSKMARTKVKDDYGNTALNYATVLNHMKCLKLLLRCGANPNIANYNDGVPVHYAAVIGDVDIINLLIQHRCDLGKDAADKSFCALFPKGTDALFNALHFNNLTCAKLLLESGGDVHKTMKNLDEFWADYQFFTGDETNLDLPHTLKYSYTDSSRDILTLLLRANGEIELQKDSKISNYVHEHILHPAIRNKDYDLVHLLSTIGCQVTEADLRCAAANEPDIHDWWMEFHKTPRTLKDLCRLQVRSSMKSNVLHKVSKVELPPLLKDYITISSPAHFTQLHCEEEF